MRVLNLFKISTVDSLEEKKEKILNKQSYDLFTVSYEMLLHEKQRNLGGKCFVKRVFKPVRIFRNKGKTPNDWRYGLEFSEGCENVMVRLTESLKNNGAYWKYLTKKVNNYHKEYFF